MTDKTQSESPATTPAGNPAPADTLPVAGLDPLTKISARLADLEKVNTSLADQNAKLQSQLSSVLESNNKLVTMVNQQKPPSSDETKTTWDVEDQAQKLFKEMGIS